MNTDHLFFLNIRNVFSMNFTNPKKIRNRLLFCLVLDLILYRVFPSFQRKDWPKQFTAFFIFSNKIGHVVKRGKEFNPYIEKSGNCVTCRAIHSKIMRKLPRSQNLFIKNDNCFFLDYKIA